MELGLGSPHRLVFRSRTAPWSGEWDGIEGEVAENPTRTWICRFSVLSWDGCADKGTLHR